MRLLRTLALAAGLLLAPAVPAQAHYLHASTARDALVGNPGDNDLAAFFGNSMGQSRWGAAWHPNDDPHVVKNEVEYGYWYSCRVVFKTRFESDSSYRLDDWRVTSSCYT